MKKSTDRNRTDFSRAWQGLGGALGAIVLTTGLSACSAAAHKAKTTEVIAIDRSRSTSATGTWPQEVAGIAKEQTAKAFDRNADSLVLLSIGSNNADSARVARVSLDLDCSNANTCRDDQTNIAAQIGVAAGQVAGTPVAEVGTDIVAALNTAKAICGSGPCVITLITDAQDSRLFGQGTADELVARHIGEFPKLTGAKVHVIGLGADQRDAAGVQRTRDFWLSALQRAGATDIQIARSL